MYHDQNRFDLRAGLGLLTPAVKGLMLACTGVFMLQVLMPRGMEAAFVHWFGLSVEGLLGFRIWQFVTYAFIHGSLLHLLLNMLGLFFLGPELERTMGRRSFIALFLFCAVLGGLGWLFLTYPYEGICVGASGGVFGLIGAFAGLFPHRQLTLLVFFVLPVTMPAWLLAVLFGLMQLAYLLNPGASGIAYAAHLAGGIAGFLYVRFVHNRHDGFIQAAPGRRVWFSRRTTAAPGPSPSEIDRILDKITTEGIHSLTPRERAILQQAGRNGR